MCGLLHDGLSNNPELELNKIGDILYCETAPEAYRQTQCSNLQSHPNNQRFSGPSEREKRCYVPRGSRMIEALRSIWLFLVVLVIMSTMSSGGEQSWDVTPPGGTPPPSDVATDQSHHRHAARKL